ncbi:restriction of telomere capping protein 5 [Dothidotthia symphoricarpi CBS 119687]|uniref:Restriction of telomere capping protein 5 n=1 Tax=Dothidotthia symphoricarpi CBS 119687 TaxID=1392245 RepID=A0A6A6AP47_9PLEO|nr:restriction of telomere capping protein 5 [Dothidotthia symphoricarpi CBS 119687]KAF2132281.1 restriction of telomere capping protein 5 [Dothidotthia symphoricarpi CBS 119687]
MGQGTSHADPHLTLEQLSYTIAQRFAQKSFSPLELYCFNSVFRSLADTESGVRYWSEATLCRFLELPDALGVGSVVFQMASYLGAFPFASQAPAILTHEALLKVVTILTERYGAVVKKRGRELWLRELYRSMAIYDNGIRPSLEETENDISKSGGTKGSSSNLGFAIDAPGGDEEDGQEEEDDELVLAALESMDALETFRHGEQSHIQHSMIPTDNLLKLVELLLLIAPIDAQQSISTLAPEMSDDRVEELREVANVIVSSFGIEKHPGVTYRTFNTVISASLPYVFDGLNPLFEHFLFAKDFDLSKRRKSSTTSPTAEALPVIPPPKPVADPEPILRNPGDILSLTLLSQLSFFIKGSNLFRRLRPLYSGNTHGFSMGSFEKQCFNWRAPTILLVSGRLLPSTPSSTRERALQDMIPPKRFPDSISETAENQTLTYGAYIPTQWKHHGKTCFGDSTAKLFQLSPTHDVFSASDFSHDYVYFNKSPTHPAGLGFGTPVPHQSAHMQSHSLFRPGPVSLHLDDALEFGIFTHLAEGGGSFHPSKLPCRKGKDWQDRFEIERLEVWGCGGDEIAEAQRKEWAWQEREAEARRRINLGTGDMEADRQLLEMAGLVGAGRSGGSMT